jgi:DNA-binding PadR family transcriptional regulator
MQLQQSSYAVLSTLRDAPRHGWSVRNELAKMAERPPSVATIYAALERLRSTELIRESSTEVVDGRARVIYEITEAGTNALHAHAQSLMKLANRVLMQPVSASTRTARVASVEVGVA